jgi:hypothetical protein
LGLVDLTAAGVEESLAALAVDSYDFLLADAGAELALLGLALVDLVEETEAGAEVVVAVVFGGTWLFRLSALFFSCIRFALEAHTFSCELFGFAGGDATLFEFGGDLLFFSLVA